MRLFWNDVYLILLIYFLDSKRPEVKCPSDINVNAESYQTSAWVSWKEPVKAYDDRDGTIT